MAIPGRGGPQCVMELRTLSRMDGGVSGAIGLRQCYAMSGTELAYGGITRRTGRLKGIPRAVSF
eukprot:705750-Rhodomonas_salina.5